MQRRRSIRGVIRLIAVLATALAAMSYTAAGEDGPPAVGLDKLLKIPRSMEFAPTELGHSNKAEWRERFDEVDGELAQARADLAATQARLAELGSSSSAWTMGAPGLSSVDREVAVEAPLDQGLRQDMKRHRASVERAEQRRAELEVEANLANVPDDWRGTPKSESEEAQALR